MKNYFKTTMIAVLISMAFTNCSKDKIKGCTDPAASNYNSKAEESDGSCIYPPPAPQTYTVEYKFEKTGTGNFTVYYVKDGVTYTVNNAIDGWTTSFTGTAGDYVSITSTPPVSGTSVFVNIYYDGQILSTDFQLYPTTAEAHGTLP